MVSLDLVASENPKKIRKRDIKKIRGTMSQFEIKLHALVTASEYVLIRYLVNDMILIDFS